MLHNKIDMAQRDRRNESETVITRSTESSSAEYELEFDVSAKSGEGLDPLLAALANHAQKTLASGESVLITRERHRRALEDTVAALHRAATGDLAGKEDLLAEELRTAAHALARLTGRVDVEDVLDVIFRDFCIGK